MLSPVLCLNTVTFSMCVSVPLVSSSKSVKPALNLLFYLIQHLTLLCHIYCLVKTWSKILTSYYIYAHQFFLKKNTGYRKIHHISIRVILHQSMGSYSATPEVLRFPLRKWNFLNSTEVFVHSFIPYQLNIYHVQALC